MIYTQKILLDVSPSRTGEDKKDKKKEKQPLLELHTPKPYLYACNQPAAKVGKNWLKAVRWTNATRCSNINTRNSRQEV